ncbi:MAG: hypothetical protein ACP5N9_04115 [Candidatus Bilamarchaeum sp.]|jgi:hypothetical protein
MNEQLEDFNRKLEEILSSREYNLTKIKIRELEVKINRSSPFSIHSISREMIEYFHMLKQSKPKIYDIFEQKHKELIGRVIKQRTNQRVDVE